MPLKKGTSEKAFVHNLKTEMEHGHPQKQSLAIAYAMRRKAQRKKMAMGGPMEQGTDMGSDSLAKKYADGGNTSPDLPGAESFQEGLRKATHYADGGGIHEQVNAMHGGRSAAGIHAEVGKNTPKWEGVEHPTETSKKMHAQKLAELKSMPNPKLQGMAEGGFIDEELASGYHEMPEEHELYNEMAMSEDDKSLNQHMPDMHASEDEEDGLVNRIMHKKYSEGGRVSNDVTRVSGEMPDQFDDLHLRDELESSYGEDDNAGDSLDNAGENERRADMADRIMLRYRKQRIPPGYPGR
jgi:hypothetical protein